MCPRESLENINVPKGGLYHGTTYPRSTLMPI